MTKRTYHRLVGYPERGQAKGILFYDFPGPRPDGTLAYEPLEFKDWTREQANDWMNTNKLLTLFERDHGLRELPRYIVMRSIIDRFELPGNEYPDREVMDSWQYPPGIQRYLDAGYDLVVSYLCDKFELNPADYAV